MIAFNIYYF
uniref:Uncharacterized protein n=1 Tax=Anguilla anguilla TaxID=7936 RepID=A0A0E9U4H2_ANGAN